MPSRFVVALLCTLCALCSTATAVEPVLVLPFTKDCEVDQRLTDEVIAALKDLYLPRPVKTQTVLSPAQAAQALRAECPNAQGVILGGHVQTRPVRRARVFAVHPGTTLPVVKDVFCDRPDCDLTAAVYRAAWALAKSPTTDNTVRPWSDRPTYCADPNAPVAKPIERSGKLVLALYGDKFPKAAAAALQKDLSHKQLVLAPPSTKPQNGHLALLPLLEGDAKGQILIVEHSKEGTVLWLYDALTNQTYQEPKIVECPGCSPEKLAERIGESARDHLAHCFDPDCPQSSRLPPEEACNKPFETDLCPQAQAQTANRHIDPSTKKWVLGATWGLVAAGAVTSLGLAIANTTDAGQRHDDQIHVSNTLSRPAWAALGLTGLAVLVALPTTIVVTKAGRPLGKAQEKVIVCPAN